MFIYGLGMNPDIRVLKRNYCCICGKKLKRKFSILTYKIKRSFGYQKDVIIILVYVCKNCNYEIEYSKQKKIRLIQKECGLYILPDGKELIKKVRINEYFDKESGFYLKN